MDTFKQFIKKNYAVKKFDDIPSISEPIHFKHVKVENKKKKTPLKEDVLKKNDWIKNKSSSRKKHITIPVAKLVWQKWKSK